MGDADAVEWCMLGCYSRVIVKIVLAQAKNEGKACNNIAYMVCNVTITKLSII